MTRTWDEFLRLRLADNSVKAILIATGVILIAFIVRRLMSSLIANLLLRLFSNKSRNLYKSVFKKEVVLPFARFLFWFITFTAIEQLNTPYELKYRIFRRSIHLWMLSIDDMVNIINFTSLLIGIKQFIIVIWKHNAQEKGNKASFQMLSVIGDLIGVVLGLIGFLMILKIAFKQDIGGFVTNLSLVTAALALAAKESLENLIASFIIFLDKPFYVGDYVKVVNISGTIESIGLRSTRIRTQDKSLITVPNKQMVDSVLDNVTYGTHRRFFESLEVSLDTNAQQLTTLVQDIEKLLEQNSNLGVENHIVYLKQTGSNAHIIYVEYLVNAQTKPALYDYYHVNSIINREIVAIFEREKIHFAQASSTVVNIQQAPPADEANGNIKG